MRTIDALRLPFALIAALHVSGANANNTNGAYDDSPYMAWFAEQYDQHGGWCCNLADGHRYDGNYTMNPDGTVTLPVTLDGIPYNIVIEAFKVLDGTTSVVGGAVRGGPNPTGHAVVWSSSEQLTIDASNIYCFSPGNLG